MFHWQLLSKWHNFLISLLLGKLMVTRRKQLSVFILERHEQRQGTPLVSCLWWGQLTWTHYTLAKPWLCTDEVWETCNPFQTRHHGMRPFSALLCELKGIMSIETTPPVPQELSLWILAFPMPLLDIPNQLDPTSKETDPHFAVACHALLRLHCCEYSMLF